MITPDPTVPPATFPPSSPTPSGSALPTLTPTPTNTPTPEPLIPHIRYFDTPDAKKLGLGLVIVCGIGLVATLFFGFIKKK